MDWLYRLLLDPAWWCSAVLINLLIGLGTAYAKPVLDRWLSNRSAKKRQAAELERKRITAYVQGLQTDPVEVISLKLDLVSVELTAVWVLVLTLAQMAIPVAGVLASSYFGPYPSTSKALPLAGIILYLVGLFGSYRAGIYIRQAREIRAVLGEYRRVKRQETKGLQKPSL